ncbi:MAG: hypothetical protein IPQ07_26455 [Myxococcales bacterium]|nr:hypothetical protein [Myxococcales bacterium]
MATPEETIEDYIALWGTSDPAARRAHATASLTDDVVLLYPTFDASGLGDVLAKAEGFQQSSPGAKIVRRSGVQHHKGCVRVAWKMVRADGTVAGEGESIGELAPDGRMKRVYGFRDPLPPSTP